MIAAAPPPWLLDVLFVIVQLRRVKPTVILLALTPPPLPAVLLLAMTLS